MPNLDTWGQWQPQLELNGHETNAKPKSKGTAAKSGVETPLPNKEAAAATSCSSSSNSNSTHQRRLMAVTLGTHCHEQENSGSIEFGVGDSPEPDDGLLSWDSTNVYCINTT